MSEKIAGSLKEREAAQLARHLEQCARCRATWQSVEQVEQLLQSAPVVDPPPGLTQSVLEQLDDVQSPTARPLSIWARAGILVTAALALMLIGSTALVLSLGRNLAQANWMPFQKGGQQALAAVWDSVRQIFRAFGPIVQASWQALRWPWIPLFVLLVVILALLWSWFWRNANTPLEEPVRSRRRTDRR
ncbi:MAG: hypothetical protein JXA37_06985 [Chloroflexia bacterium]|nr:hypothetical protein [Chloroflexia bacterium]